ncbi:MAG: VOC family protein [Minwuiales bacterium]|nr:VOC family protein [Minwuiales bacterium]
MTAHGAFHWNELMTRDIAQAKDFYGKTLGWTFEDMPMPDGITYTIIKSGDTDAGGMLKMEGPQFEGMSPHWMSYIAVDDVDAAVGKVEAAGGQVAAQPFDIPTVGRIAVIVDPTGAAISLMTPADQG